MFVQSHLFGPLLGLILCLWLLLSGLPADYRLAGFAALVAGFWLYPLLLRATGRYRLLSLCSIQHLQLTILWASHCYGGLMSPFLLWLAVVPLLAFLYLSPSQRLWLGLVGGIGVNVALFVAVTLNLPPPETPEASLHSLSVVSIVCAAAYVALMAVNFGRILSSRSAIELEAADHEAAVAALSRRRSQLIEAGNAKSETLALLSREAGAPLADMQASGRLLLEDADRKEEGDTTELRSIAEAARFLSDVVEDVDLYCALERETSSIACSAVDPQAVIAAAVEEMRPSMTGRTELVAATGGRACGTIETDGGLLRQALLSVGRHLSQLPLGPRLEWRAERLPGDGGDQIVIDVVEAAEANPADGNEPSPVARGAAARQGGHGLSLAVAARICRLLGGSLIEAPGNGARVRFRIRVPAIASAGARPA